MPIITLIAWRTALVITVLNAASAVGGAVAIFLTNGLGMPLSMLAGSPFTSFLVPGLILLVVVGGTQTLAAVLQIRRRRASLVWMAFAGFTMIIWILVETIVIQGFGLLQALYFASGTVQIILTLALLGLVAWVPRIDLRVARARGR
jgi:hypothetical protein